MIHSAATKGLLPSRSTMIKDLLSGITLVMDGEHELDETLTDPTCSLTLKACAAKSRLLKTFSETC